MAFELFFTEKITFLVFFNLFLSFSNLIVLCVISVSVNILFHTLCVQSVAAVASQQQRGRGLAGRNLRRRGPRGDPGGGRSGRGHCRGDQGPHQHQGQLTFGY